MALGAAMALFFAGGAVAADDYAPVRGLGPAKAAGKGLLRVQLRDRTTVLTHGLDPKAPAAGERAVDFTGPERQPVCASDYFQHVLYGYPADGANRLDAVKATVVAEIRRMDALLNEDALASGGHSADYKVKCDGTGEIQVDSFRSGETSAQTTFSGVVSAARAAGFTQANADYTIFFDSSAPSACGTGTYTPDERLTGDNANNQGGDYGVVYSDCWTDRTAMHENGHNQGAVQYSAPWSTGSGAHCNDGYDIMCYSDGGDRDIGMSIFCTDKMHFDCRYDSYFDTAPEAGEYLADHWNIGSPLNRFITFDGAGPVADACSDGLDNDGDGKRDFPADLGCIALSDTDELDPPACLNLRDDDGDAKVDFPLDPGCSSALDTSEADPIAAAPAPPAQQPAAAPSLPTLTMSSARRYARRQVKRKYPHARRIRARCARRTRTKAACTVRFTAARGKAFAAKVVVRYRLRNGVISVASSSRARRIR